MDRTYTNQHIASENLQSVLTVLLVRLAYGLRFSSHTALLCVSPGENDLRSATMLMYNRIKHQSLRVAVGQKGADMANIITNKQTNTGGNR